MDNNELNGVIYELGRTYAHFPDRWSKVADYLRLNFDIDYFSNNALRKRAKRYEKQHGKKDIKPLGVEIGEGIVKSHTPDYDFNVPFEAENVLIISDLHFPFAKKGWLDFILRCRDKYKCETVLSIGDILDHHALSQWVSNPDGFSSGHEIDKACQDVQKLNGYFPDLRICLGNHDTRHMTSAMKAGLSSRYLRHMNEILDVNWQWNYSFVQSGKVLYTHGDENSGFYATQNIAMKESMSVVSGHTHSSPNVSWFRNHNKTFFSLNVGCLIDETSYAMAYGKKNAYKIINGLGVVLNRSNDPLFIRYEC